MKPSTRKLLALLLAASQVLTPLFATAATYQMQASVPTLRVDGSPVSVGTPGSGNTGGSTGSGGGTSGSGSSGSGSTGSTGGTGGTTSGGTPPSTPVNPPSGPSIYVSSAAVDFGDVLVGEAAKPATVLLTNSGPGDFTLSSTPTVVGAGFSVTTDCALTLASGASCHLTLGVTPAKAGVLIGGVYIAGNALNTPLVITPRVNALGLTTTVGLSAVALDFGSQLLQTTSATQSVLVLNTGNTPVSIASPVTTGPYAATTDCTPTLAPAASCHVNVAFTPTLQGSQAGQLSLGTGAGAQSVTLSGIGLQASADVNTTTLAFGDVVVGNTSASQALVLSNHGNMPLELSPAVLSGPYSMTSTCAGVLAAGEACSYAVSYVPLAMGDAAGVLTLTTALGPKAVLLSGHGLQSVDATAPTSLTFGDVKVGEVSTAQAVTLSNVGNTPTQVTAVSVSGPFVASQNCGPLPGALAPSSSCEVSVTFAPSAMGNATGVLTLGTSNGVHNIPLTGTGLLATATLSATALDLGASAVGVASPTQSLTLTNSGNTALALSATSLTGPFTQLSDCPASLAVGAHCAVAVTFLPTAMGQATGALTFNTDLGATPVVLTGTGLLAVAALTPAALDFGNVNVGAQAAAQGATLTNSGNTDLSVAPFVSSGPFTVVTTCGATLAPAATCLYNVSFNPVARGTAAGTVTVPTGAGAKTLALTGVGLLPTATLDISGLSFGDVPLGSTSAMQVATLTNNGNAPLSVQSALVSGPFAPTTTCVDTLAPGASCAYQVSFTPLAMGPVAGTLTVNTGLGAQSISLTGTGLQTSDAAAPLALNFGSVAVGGTSAASSVALSNTGNTGIVLTSVAVSGPFVAAQNCGALPATVPASSACQVRVSFVPTAMGTAQGALLLTTNAGVKTIVLSGTGLLATATLGATSLALGDTPVGGTSSAQSVSLTNNGNTPLALLAAAVTGPFAQSSTCAATLEAGASCAYRVTFLPTSSGAVSGVLTVNTVLGAQLVSLSGTGLLAVAHVSPGALDLGSVNVGSTSAATTVTLSNTGNTSMSVGTPTLTGAYAQSTTCGTTLAAGSQCQVSLTFNPTAMGAAAGSLVIPTGAGTQTVSLSGTGLLATATLGSTNLSFGNVTVGSTSLTQSVVLTNNGNTPLSVAAAAVTGAYAQTTTCSATLAAGASCAYRVAFAPTVMGSATGALTVNTDLGAQTVSLTGMGLQTSTAASTANLLFGNVNVGSTSLAQVVTLSNTGNTAVGVSALTTTGPFAATQTCGTLPATLAASNNCQVSVTFAPTAMGPASGTLTLTTDGGVQVVALSGTGLLATATLSATNLALGSVNVGATSAAQSVTLTNNGNTLLAVSPALSSGPFAQTTTCGPSLAPGASCAYIVTLTPTTMGVALGSLTLMTALGTQTVSLSGMGLLGVPGVNTSSVAFGSVNVGASSAVQTVTLSNTGNTAFSVGAPALSGPFAKTTTCGTTLVSGDACTFSLTFNPTAMGAAAGSLSIPTGAGTQTVSLSGTGLLATATLSATTLALGSVNVGSASPAQSVTLTNNGNTALSIATSGVTAPFATTTTCATSLAAAASCTYSVTLTPTAMGAASGTLTVNTVLGAQSVSLTGTGLLAVAGVSPSSVAFGSLNVGSTSSATTVTLSNTGNTSMSVGTPTLTGAFGKTTTCGASLSAGSSCTFSLTFSPTVMGAASGSLSIPTGVGTQTVTLSGTGLLATASLSATTLSLGSVNVGSTSSAQSVTLTNNGNTPLTVSTAGITSPFANTTTCTTSLAAGASCTYSTTLTPTAMGAASGTLTVNTGLGAQTVSLSGTGLLAIAGVSPSSVAFGSLNVGSTSSATTVTLSNTGNTSMSVGTPTLTGAFGQSTTCGATLAASGSCTFSLTFSPTVMGAASGSLSIPTGAGTQTVTLSGTGLLATATLSGTSLAFGNVTVGQTSVAQSVTLTNNGNTPLTVSSAGITAPFTNTTTCTTSLAAGASCAYSVTLTPTVMGAASGTLTVNTGLGAQTVALSGTGLQTSSSASTASLAFGSINVSSTSTAQVVTLSNTGNTSVSVTAIATSGPFAATQTCGTLPATVATSGSCQVSVTFTPTVMGAASGTLTLTTSGGTQSVSLTGTGLQATATLSATTLALGSVNVGSTSTAQSVTLTNNGNTPLTVAAAGITAPFAKTTTCTASLAAGASCAYSVTLTPTAMGAASGTLTVNTDLGAQTVTLSGTGLQATLSTSVTTLTLATTQVGQTSTSASVTLTNTGNTTATSLTLTPPTGYTVTGSTCGATLASNASCVFTVQFAPTAAQAYTGNLSITSNAATVTVSLTGTGAAQALTKTTADNFSFNVAQGATSGVMVWVQNTGYGPVTVNSLTSTVTSGNWTASMASSGTGSANGNFCWPGAVLQVNDTCKAWVQDTGWSAQGSVSSGTATFNTSAGSYTYTGSLTVKGLTLGTVSTAIVQTSASATGTLYTATIANNTTFPFYLPEYTVNGGLTNLGAFTGTNAANFVVTGTTCSGTILASTSCTVSMGATGLSTAGTYSATFNLNGTFQQSGAGTGGVWSAGQWLANMGSTLANVYLPNTIAVSVQAQAPADTVSAGSLAFANTYLGSTTAAKSITLTNTGVGAVTVSTPTVGTANYAVTHNCPASLAASATCTVNVTFNPLTAGAQADTLTIPTSAATQTVTLSGTGLAATVALNFDSANGSTTLVDTGTPGGTAWTSNNAAAASTTYYRQGTASLALNGTNQTLSGPAVNLTGDFTVSAWIRPATSGAVSAVVGQWDQSRTAGWLVRTSSTNTLLFYFGPYNGSTPLLTSTASLPTNVWTHIAVTRQGSAFTVYVNGVASGTATFAGAGPVLTTAVSVGNYYNAGVMGAGGNVFFNGNIDGLTLVNGQATAPSVTLSTLSASAPSFAATALNVTSAVNTVTVTNGAAAPVTITSVASTGSSEFAVTNAANCTGATLAPNASCTVSMTATPTAAGTRSGTLTVTSSDASNSPLAVALTTTGLQAVLAFTPTSANFGSVQVGQTSSVAATLTNTGNTTATGLGGSLPTGFTVASVAPNPCGTTLAAGVTCNLSFTFSPTAVQAYSGSFTVPSTNAATVSFAMTGTGVAASDTTSVGSLTFASTNIGTSSTPQYITLTNTGVGPVTVGTPTLGTANFSASYNCPATLAAGANCLIAVTLVPVSAGALTDTLTLPTGAGAKTVSLSGTGVRVDPYFSLVGLLLHMDGTSGSTAFPDVKNNTVVANGAVAISTASAKFGGASGVFDGTTAYLSTSTLAPFTGDWTIEGWVNPTRNNVSAGESLFNFNSWSGASPSQGGIHIWRNSSNQLVVDDGVNGYANSALTGGTFSASTWTHVAVVHSGTVTTGYLNGVAVGSNNFTPMAWTKLNIGRYSYSTSPMFFAGYMDEVQVTPGVARYAGNFTPPGTAFPVSVGLTTASPFQYQNGAVGVSCLAYHTGSSTYAAANTSGNYVVNGGSGNQTVYCDMTTNGGGWTLIARSQPGNATDWACNGTPSTATFGWLSSTGALSNDAAAYNLNATLIAPWTQIMFGGYTTGKTWDGNVYQHNVASDFLTTWANAHYAIGLPTPVVGGNTGFGMASYIGFTSNTTTYHWRDVDGNGFGLSSLGWASCYGTIAAPATYGGNLNAKQGMIMVR